MKRAFQLLAVLAVGFLGSCEQPKQDYWLGYIEGELALIAPPQPGWITSIDVARGAKIKPGVALFKLDAVRQVAGEVQDVYFRQGEYANAGAPVVAVLPPANVFVRFFVPEPEISKLMLGSPVRISCDGCAADLTGTVTFIASQVEFTPPVIYS